MRSSRSRLDWDFYPETTVTPTDPHADDVRGAWSWRAAPVRGRVGPFRRPTPPAVGNPSGCTRNPRTHTPNLRGKGGTRTTTPLIGWRKITLSKERQENALCGTLKEVKGKRFRLEGQVAGKDFLLPHLISSSSGTLRNLHNIV